MMEMGGERTVCGSVFSDVAFWLIVFTVMNPDRSSDMVGTAAHPGGFQRRMRADENDIFNGKNYDTLQRL